MTRALLSLALSGLTLAVGLWTCLVATWNHQRADQLVRLQRRHEMQRAANDQLAALVSAHVWGLPDGHAAGRTTPAEPAPEGLRP